MDKISTSIAISFKKQLRASECQRLILKVDIVAKEIAKKLKASQNYQTTILPISDNQLDGAPIVIINLQNFFAITLSNSDILIQVLLAETSQAESITNIIKLEVESIFDTLEIDPSTVKAGKISITTRKKLSDLSSIKSFMQSTSFSDQADKLTDLGFQFIRFDETTNVAGISGRSTEYASYALSGEKGILITISYLLGGVSINHGGMMPLEASTVKSFVNSFKEATPAQLGLKELYGPTK